jgi:hypothetical protein
LRQDVLQRGQCCTKEDLDLVIKSDQMLYERIAEEYNKKDVDENNRIQFPIGIAPNNMPTKFTDIHWTEVNLFIRRAGSQLKKQIMTERFLWRGG